MNPSRRSSRRERTRGGRRLASCLGAWLALAAVAAGQARDGERAVRDEALQLVHELGDTWPQVPVLQEALLELGSEITRPLFDLLVAGEVPAVGDLPARALDARREHALLTALEFLPRAPVVAVIEGTALASVPAAQRIEALRVLARFASAADLRLIARLGVSESRGSDAGFELRRATEDTFTQVLRRDPKASAALATLLPELHPALHRLAVDALGALGGPLALDALTLALGRSPALDAVILVEVRHLALQLPRPPGPLPVGHVSGALASQDPSVRALAARALQAMDARRAVPDLIPLLDDPTPGLRVTAQGALQSLSAQKMAQEGRAWSQWYEAEASWYWTARPERARTLRDESGPSAAAAVRELAAHRIFHDDLVADLLPGLESTDPQLVALTCGAFAYLGSWRAVDALTEYVESPDPVVREAARAALTSITGLDLPENGAYWRTRIALLEENP